MAVKKKVSIWAQVAAINELIGNSKEAGSAWAQSMEVQVAIQKWMEKHEQKSIKLRYSPFEQMRLLRLKSWALQERLSVYEVLSLIVPVLKGQMSQQKKGFGLGISAGTLTSDSARRILSEEIKRAYPDNEHLAIWKARERKKQLKTEKKYENGGVETQSKPLIQIEYDSPEQFITDYLESVEKQRKGFSPEVLKQRKTRRYRWSPWI